MFKMQILRITTKKEKQIVDITEQIEKILKEQSAKEGICFLFTRHTTAALTTADLDPGTDRDMLDAFEAMMPKLRYRHPHNPSHVPDHIMSSVIGASVFVPFTNKKMMLGTWQKIILVELSGPRSREIVVEVQNKAPAQ